MKLRCQEGHQRQSSPRLMNQKFDIFSSCIEISIGLVVSIFEVFWVVEATKWAKFFGWAWQLIIFSFYCKWHSTVFMKSQKFFYSLFYCKWHSTVFMKSQKFSISIKTENFTLREDIKKNRKKKMQYWVSSNSCSRLFHLFWVITRRISIRSSSTV